MSIRKAALGIAGRNVGSSGAQFHPVGALRHASSARKQVTVAGDDGRVRWGELSLREKAARSTQQSFNLLIVFTGIIMTVGLPGLYDHVHTDAEHGGVFTFLYKEVFATDSKTRHFNRAFDRVKQDARTVELLGSRKKLKAYGEPTWNKWSRVRPIASRTEKRGGTEHFFMHFNVEGPLDKGVVNMHMTKRPGQDEFEYRYLALDVKGHPRVFIENADEASGSKKGMKLFGVRWG